MDVLVAQDIRVVLLGGEAHIRFIVEPDGERVPISHKHPLSDVELAQRGAYLAFVDYQRVLHVFLNHPLLLFVLGVA